MLSFSKKCSIIQYTYYCKVPKKNQNKKLHKKNTILVFLRSPKHFNKGKHKVYFSNTSSKSTFFFKNKVIPTTYTLNNNLSIFTKKFNIILQTNYSFILYHSKIFFKYQFYL